MHIGPSSGTLPDVLFHVWQNDHKINDLDNKALSGNDVIPAMPRYSIVLVSSLVGAHFWRCSLVEVVLLLNLLCTFRYAFQYIMLRYAREHVQYILEVAATHKPAYVHHIFRVASGLNLLADWHRLF